MGLPSELTKGVIDTAAEMIKFCAPSWLRSICRKERKLALSFTDTKLQPVPCLLGSQLQNRWIKIFETLKQIKINALKFDPVQAVRIASMGTARRKVLSQPNLRWTGERVRAELW